MILRHIAALAACGVLAIGSVSVSAHHSTAMYNMANPVTVSGIVTRFEWTNPHAFVYVNVKDESGKIVEWEVEMMSLNHLKGYKTLKTEHFELKYDPANDAALAAYMGEYLEGVHAELAKKFQWTNDDQNSVARSIAVDKLSDEEAAKKWVEANPDKVQAWLPAGTS